MLRISCGQRETSSDANIAQVEYSLGLENFGINPWCVGSLHKSFGSDWGMDVANGFEGGGQLICKVGGIGGWVCVERGSADVIFEIVNISGIVGTVLDGSLLSCREYVWEEFECERFVIGLVGFMVRKMCDNSRAGSCDEQINGVTIT